MQNTMTIEQILAQLDVGTNLLPREALQQAQSRATEITPHLLAILRQVLAQPTKEWPDGYLGLHAATYLLAAFREPLAFPLILQLCHLPEQASEDLFGDTVTDDMPRILAAVCGDDADALCALFVDHQANPFIRSGAAKAMGLMWLDGRLSRAQLEARFHQLLNTLKTDELSYAGTGLVDACVDVGAAPWLFEIEALFENEQILTGVFDLGFVHRSLKRTPAMVREELLEEDYAAPIVDVVEEFESWAWFDPDDGRIPFDLAQKVEPQQKAVSQTPGRPVSSKDKAAKKTKRAMAKQSRKKNRR